MAEASLYRKQGAQPWDFKPLKGFKKFIANLSCIVLFILALEGVMCILILPFLIMSKADLSTWNILGMFGIWLVIIFVTFLIIKAIQFFNRRLSLSKLEKKMERQQNETSIFLVQTSMFRYFKGVGRIKFNDNSMSVDGQLGPNLLIPFLVIIAVDIVFGLMIPLIIIGGMGAVVILLIYNFIASKPYSLLVSRENILLVVCKGPIVTIKFLSPPVSLLRRIRIFVPSSFRFNFFQQFNSTFSMVLPENYQEALKAD